VYFCDRISVENAYIDEKEDACSALGELALNTGYVLYTVILNCCFLWCKMHTGFWKLILPHKTAVRKLMKKTTKLEMWANAQCDGRPAKYRWRPLFDAAKFGWRPILDCRAVTLPKCETRWNLLGCPKLRDRSHMLVGRSSPYYQNMWRRYFCLTSFFSSCWYVP